MDAKDYFELKLAQAQKSEVDADLARFDSKMRVAAWRVEVFVEVLKRLALASALFNELVVPDDKIPEIDAYVADDYHFTCDECRGAAAIFCMAHVRTPIFALEENKP